MSKAHIECVCGKIFEANIMFESVEYSLTYCPNCGCFYEKRTIEPTKTAPLCKKCGEELNREQALFHDTCEDCLLELSKRRTNAQKKHC